MRRAGCHADLRPWTQAPDLLAGALKMGHDGPWVAFPAELLRWEPVPGCKKQLFAAFNGPGFHSPLNGPGFHSPGTHFSPPSWTVSSAENGSSRLWLQLAPRGRSDRRNWVDKQLGRQATGSTSNWADKQLGRQAAGLIWNWPNGQPALPGGTIGSERRHQICWARAAGRKGRGGSYAQGRRPVSTRPPLARPTPLGQYNSAETMRVANLPTFELRASRTWGLNLRRVCRRQIKLPQDAPGPPGQAA
jgi:hypothetical protein